MILFERQSLKLLENKTFARVALTWFSRCDESTFILGSRHSCQNSVLHSSLRRVATLCLHAKHLGSMKQADQKMSLRAQTKGSSGGDIKSLAARHCVFLRDAALKMAPEMPQIAADLMSSAQSVARENNLPRSLLKGVLCCPACSYPAERGAQSQQSSYQQCQVCAFAPRVRRRRNRARPKTAANLPARKEARA